MDRALSNQTESNQSGLADNEIASGKRWVDHKNYPRGFDRSGDFTLQQAKLLEKYGKTITQLSCGERKPASTAEQRMLDVIAGNEIAESELEKLWLLYLQRTHKRNRQVGLCSVDRDLKGRDGRYAKKMTEKSQPANDEMVESSSEEETDTPVDELADDFDDAPLEETSEAQK